MDSDEVTSRCAEEARDKIIRFSVEGGGRRKAVLGAPNEYKGKSSVASDDLGWGWTNTTAAGGTTLATISAEAGKGVGLHSKEDNQAPVLHTDYLSSSEQFGDISVAATRPGGQAATLRSAPNDDYELFFDKWATRPGHPEEPNWLYYWKQLPIIDSMVQALPPVYMLDGSRGGCDSMEARVPIRFAYDSTLYTFIQIESAKPQENSQGSTQLIIGSVEEVPADHVGGNGGNVSDLFRSSLFRVSKSEHPECDGIYRGSNDIFLNARFDDSLTITVGRAAALKFSESSESGLASFIEIVRHELNHIKLKIDQLQGRLGSEIDSEPDGYLDSWERNFQTVHSDYTEIGIDFIVGRDDSYQSDYVELGCFDSSDYDPSSGRIDTIKCSAGTLFEELFIRKNAVWLDQDLLKEMDWSYDDGHLELSVPKLNRTHQAKAQGLQW